MFGSRILVAGIVVFATGLGAAIYGVNRYNAAYAWVAHTSDVRLVIGRAIGHAGRVQSCEGLRQDLAELARLTADNAIQQQRFPGLAASVELVCTGKPAPELVDQLAQLDATERMLMAERRDRVADDYVWTIVAFAGSTLGSMLVVFIAIVLQRRARTTLARSEERFRTMASTARELLRIHDPTGRPTYCSPSVERLLGFTPEEMIATTPLSLGHPDDADRMKQTLADVQKDHGPGTTLIYRLRHKDGTYRWFETHTNPVRDAQGKLLRFYTSARDITERVELERQLELTAVTDDLTGLLNRRGFTMIGSQELRVAIRQTRGIAVIFADLDGLKSINDKLGHDQGDRAIRRLGTLLRATFRDSDVVARLGGDEFAALAYDVDALKLDAVLERLRLAVVAAAADEPYQLAVSIGVALLAPGETRTLDDLIAEADERMYENKRARKGSTDRSVA